MAAEFHPKSEFSRVVSLESLGEDEEVREIEAEEAERRALARRLGLLSLDRLSARLRLSRADRPAGRGGTTVAVAGRLAAKVTQACVVTLEPVHNVVEEELSLTFARSPEAGRDAVGAAEVTFAPEEAEPPEPIAPEGIDLGEAVVQQLAVALDPYPRAPGVEPGQADLSEDADEEASDNPFRALEALKRKE